MDVCIQNKVGVECLNVAKVIADANDMIKCDGQINGTFTLHFVCAIENGCSFIAP